MWLRRHRHRGFDPAMMQADDIAFVLILVAILAFVVTGIGVVIGLLAPR
jgi:hypothetical protein